MAEVSAILQQKQTARQYVELVSTKDAQDNTITTLDERSILVESEKKEPEKLKDGTPNPLAGVAVNWANAERPNKRRAGLTQFSENEFITYDINTIDGFALLYPDPKQQLYVIQKGHGAFQTQLIQSAMKALKEDATEPTPEMDGQTIDLRVGVDEAGTYSINNLPSKQKVSTLDKFIKQANALLDSLGIPEEGRPALIAGIVANLQAAATPVASEDAEEVSDEVSAE
jgi:hypothetical protein